MPKQLSFGGPVMCLLWGRLGEGFSCCFINRYSIIPLSPEVVLVSHPSFRDGDAEAVRSGGLPDSAFHRDPFCDPECLSAKLETPEHE